MKLRSRHFQLLFRAINIACAIFVSFYIFFDVLDLDGSNWPLPPRHPTKGQVFIVNDLAEAEPISLPIMVESWEKVSSYFTAPCRVLAYFSSAEALKISAIGVSHRHHYRVALPRSSVPGPLALA
jgi:hypothetical protein